MPRIRAPLAALLSRVRSLGGLVAVLLPLAAAVGCVVPWERVEVQPLGQVSARWVSAFHGSGIAACVGGGLALLMLADRLLRPAPSAIRDAGTAFAGAVVATGAFLFGSTGGFPPASGPGYRVTLWVGWWLCAVAGVLLALTVALPALLPAVWRRGGRRSPASSG